MQRFSDDISSENVTRHAAAHVKPRAEHVENVARHLATVAELHQQLTTKEMVIGALHAEDDLIIR
jgi:hypothetical protein